MIVCMVFATALFVAFILLYMGASDEVSEIMINAYCEEKLEKIKKIQIDMQLLADEVKKNHGVNKKKDLKRAKELKKKLKSAQKMLETYQKHKIAGLDLIPVAGYRLIQLLGWDASNKNIKSLYEKCQRYKEKKEAMNYTYFIYGNLFGNFILGLSCAFYMIGFTLGMGLGTRSLVVGIVVLIVFSIIGYLPYDAVSQIVKKRKEEIEQEFPQLVSQMTLLVVAGMEVSRAWNIASKGGQSTLYEEMNRVNIELDNNVSPVEAYSKFMKRCNNKYTTKLATAIIQNLSKGNSEIVSFFRQLNEESWSEHRHGSRRMSEKIQSKLFAPTMLMFAGILILVIVPVISGFNF